MPRGAKRFWKSGRQFSRANKPAYLGGHINDRFFRPDSDCHRLLSRYRASAARGFAAGGANIIINYANNADAAEAIVADCQKAGGQAVAVQADVSQESDGQRLIDAALDHFGQLDILVNNAGTTKFVDHANLEGLSQDDFEQIYGLNLIGPYQMIKLARPHLKNSDAPSIVNISSVAGVRGVGSSLAYVASKGALNSMTLGLARALGPEKIRVNAVCPGFVGTDWFRNALGEEAFTRISEGQKAVTPMNQVAGPDDITGPILFLPDAMRGM